MYHHNLRSPARSLAVSAGLGAVLVSVAAAQSGGPCLQESIPAHVAFSGPFGTIGNGRPLSSDGHRVLLQLDESHATLVEPIGPSWQPVANLTAAPGFTGTYNGVVHGDRVAFDMFSGEVGFYERGPGGWSLAQSLQTSRPVTSVLDLEDDFALVLVATAQLFVTDLVVLERTPAGWVEGANLGPFELRAIALSGRRMAIGSRPGATNPALDLYELSAGGVVQLTQSISTPPGPSAPLFGSQLALEGDRLVTTSLLDADGNGIRGSVFVYERGAAGPFQLAGRIDDPPELMSIPGVVTFGWGPRLDGDRLLVEFNVPTGGAVQTGLVVLDNGPAGWRATSILDPSLVPLDSRPSDAVMASGSLFVAAIPSIGFVRRYAVEAQQGVQICQGTAPSGPPPRLVLNGCSSASTGRLVVRGEGLRGGALFFGLARGSVVLAPGAPQTCIRSAGALGHLTPVGPNAAELIVDPALVQSVSVMFGDVLLLQAAERIVPPVGGVTVALSNAIAIELGE